MPAPLQAHLREFSYFNLSLALIGHIRVLEWILYESLEGSYEVISILKQLTW